MADRLKDNQEPGLVAMFRSDPLPDLGFSRKVMARVRRQIWIRRLTMPVALIIGGSIAIKPASDIVIAMTQVFEVLPPKLTDVAANFSSLSVSSLPHSVTILVGGVIALVALGLVRALDD